jgi:hypothetical protein
MRRCVRCWAILLLASLLTGCSSIEITDPTNGSTLTALPQPLTWTETGIDGTPTVSMDGNNLGQWSSGANMVTLAPGSHAVSVFCSGSDVAGCETTDTLNVNATSNFTVAPSACPLCYACPTGQYLHALTGLCCTGSQCDFVGFTNFGVTMLSASACSGLQADDCINQNAAGLCGGSSTGCTNSGGTVTQALAASFSPYQSGVLSQIQVPISSLPGPQANQFQAWITADSGGKPGTVLESFSLNNIRQGTFPTTTPAHIFSVAHPALTNGTTYWLVVGPAAATAEGGWNFSLADAPASGGSNFLLNNTGPVPSISGPWAPSGFPVRTAFEIDMH